MKKKILTLGLVAALSATAAIGGTLAYFTDDARATNTFTVGNVDIELVEPSWNESAAKDLVPGQIVAKDPTVMNEGANACYVRVKVEGLDQFGTDKLIGINTSDTDKWEKGADGYYYWIEPLAKKGDKTTALFTEIKMPENLVGADVKDVTVQPITVTAEAVQALGFTADSTKELNGLVDWFGTCLN